MLVETNNLRIYNEAIVNPLTATIIADNSSFQCKRTVGAGLYDKDKEITYICYSGPGMDVYLCEYSHKSKSYGDPYCVCKNNMYDRWDYHNYCNMVKMPNGEHAIFFAVHTEEMYMIQSPAWKKVKISDDYTCYPSPVVVGDDLYLFYSKNENMINGNVINGVRMHSYRSLRYTKSSDNGKTWDQPISVIDTQKSCPLEIDEVYQVGCEYVKGNGNISDRIQISWSMWGGVKGHAQSNEAAYCGYFSLTDKQMYSPSHKKLGQCIDYELMVNECLIYKTSDYHDDKKVVASVLSSVLSDGSSLVVYGVIKDGEVASIRSSILINGVWDTTYVAKGTYSVKDIYKCPHTGNISVLYAHGDYLLIKTYDEEQNTWIRESTSVIPFKNGGNTVVFANFIDNYQETLMVVLSEVDNINTDRLYEGIWPVICYGRVEDNV